MEPASVILHLTSILLTHFYCLPCIYLTIYSNCFAFRLHKFDSCVLLAENKTCGEFHANSKTTLMQNFV